MSAILFLLVSSIIKTSPPNLSKKIMHNSKFNWIYTFLLLIDYCFINNNIIITLFEKKCKYFFKFLKKVWTSAKKCCIIPYIGRSGFIFTLINLFFIILIFNLLLCFCFIYNFIQRAILHNFQGSKLKLKLKKEVL